MLCARCEAREPYEPSVWFLHVWGLYTLQRGGYPFDPDDLTVEEWTALGEIRDAMKSLRGGG